MFDSLQNIQARSTKSALMVGVMGRGQDYVIMTIHMPNQWTMPKALKDGIQTIKGNWDILWRGKSGLATTVIAVVYYTLRRSTTTTAP